MSAECPSPLHSAPFGNWGATSNFGQKRDGHQFDGWCHDTRICDNFGICRTECKDGWYEWNSCTDNPLFEPPNCTLYNANECTEQVSTTGVNVLGNQTVDLPVGCPADSDGDGVADRGGCSEIGSYSHGTNFMSLYELDRGTADELVQTLYFPEAVVSLNCSIWACDPAGSNWVKPGAYDDPPSPPKVYAEMAIVVNSGTFLNLDGVCRGVVSTLTSVSAASYTGPVAAVGSIVSAFGRALASATAATSTNPPSASLAGVTVGVTDNSGIERLAPLFFVSPDQINYVIPRGSSLGPATVRVKNGNQVVSTGTLQIAPVAPALFTANATGAGVAAATILYVHGDGSQTFQLAFECSSGAGQCTAVPIDLGTSADQAYLSLYGTGIRGHAGLSTIEAWLGGEAAEVLYAGPQGQYTGLDQVNLRIPLALSGRGETTVFLRVAGKSANLVTVSFR